MSILVYLMGKVFVLSLLAGVLYLFTFLTEKRLAERIEEKELVSIVGLFYFFVAMQLLSSWLSNL